MEHNIVLEVQTRHDYGLKTLLEVANEIGVDSGTILYHVRKDRLPVAKTTIGNLPRKYYQPEEVDVIVNFFAQNQNKKLARKAADS